MTDFEYHKTLVIGVIIGASVCILGFYMLKPENPPVTPKTNFAVVDTYSYENKTCSVIRYTTPSTSWEYFLDCNDK
jgi:dTDP-glucose pyrophosphorylase